MQDTTFKSFVECERFVHNINLLRTDHELGIVKPVDDAFSFYCHSNLVR